MIDKTKIDLLRISGSSSKFHGRILLIGYTELHFTNAMKHTCLGKYVKHLLQRRIRIKMVIVSNNPTMRKERRYNKKRGEKEERNLGGSPPAAIAVPKALMF